MTSRFIKRIGSLCAFMAATSPVVHAAHAAPATDTTSRFDQAIASGLPVAWPIRHRSAHSSDEHSALLTVTRRLPIDVSYPDGGTGAMYAGMLDGREVVMTRGDGHVDIHEGDTGAKRITHIDPPSAPSRHKRSFDEPEVEGLRTLNVHFFMHQNLRDRFTADDVHGGYVAWWLNDLTTSVLPSMRIHVYYHMSEQPHATSKSHMAPRDITDLDMRNNQALDVLSEAAGVWHDQLGDPATKHLEKFVLLTSGKLPSNIDGIAYAGGAAAIASLDGSYRVVAHELGHLLGAAHDDSAVLYRGGWWCESNMYPYTFALRSKCHVYTKENERRIRNYVIGGPDATFHPSVTIED